jgi:hypothetical protein
MPGGVSFGASSLAMFPVYTKPIGGPIDQEGGLPPAGAGVVPAAGVVGGTPVEEDGAGPVFPGYRKPPGAPIDQ